MRFIAIDPKNQPEMDRLASLLMAQTRRYWQSAIESGAVISSISVPFAFRVDAE